MDKTLPVSRYRWTEAKDWLAANKDPKLFDAIKKRIEKSRKDKEPFIFPPENEWNSRTNFFIGVEFDRMQSMFNFWFEESGKPNGRYVHKLFPKKIGEIRKIVMKHSHAKGDGILIDIRFYNSEGKPILDTETDDETG